jgi:hypothetical protein
VGGGEGPEAFNRGAAPARVSGKSKAKLPSIWPGLAAYKAMGWGDFSIAEAGGGGGLEAF